MRWWSLHHEAFAQGKAELEKLFIHAYESDLLSKYKPVALLQILRPADCINPSVDIVLIRLRRRRESAGKLDEFEKMSFAEISERLEQIDRESRERLRTGTGK